MRATSMPRGRRGLFGWHKLQAADREVETPWAPARNESPRDLLTMAMGYVAGWPQYGPYREDRTAWSVARARLKDMDRFLACFVTDRPGSKTAAVKAAAKRGLELVFDQDDKRFYKMQPGKGRMRGYALPRGRFEAFDDLNDTKGVAKVKGGIDLNVKLVYDTVKRSLYVPYDNKHRVVLLATAKVYLPKKQGILAECVIYFDLARRWYYVVPRQHRNPEIAREFASEIYNSLKSFPAMRIASPENIDRL